MQQKVPREQQRTQLRGGETWCLGEASGNCLASPEASSPQVHLRARRALSALFASPTRMPYTDHVPGPLKYPDSRKGSQRAATQQKFPQRASGHCAYTALHCKFQPQKVKSASMYKIRLLNAPIRGAESLPFGCLNHLKQMNRQFGYE